MSRADHQFNFPATQIVTAARRKERYHQVRIDHWLERQQAARARIEDAMKLELVEVEVTGGVRYHLHADPGDATAWAELQLATDKIGEHTARLAEFRTAAQMYSTQGVRDYELSTADVQWFGLDGTTDNDEEKA